MFSVAEVMAAARARGRSGRRGVTRWSDGGGADMGRARLDPGWSPGGRGRGRGVGSALLADLERRLRSAGVRRICAVMPEGATGAAARASVRATPAATGWSTHELIEHLGPDQANLLELGGQILPPGLWGDMAGMGTKKSKRHRRPAWTPEGRASASAQGPSSCSGPRPAPGKPAYKAVSSRLGWPFVEQCSRPGWPPPATGGLAASPEGLPTFRADEPVPFIDEVEEIATAAPGASTAELRRHQRSRSLIPAFRQHDSRLLVSHQCVHSLDSAFHATRPLRLRHPGQAARPAGRGGRWRRYLGAATGPTVSEIDVDRLVTASELFTPADIEFAARKGAVP